jgi:hypothetical protein
MTARLVNIVRWLGPLPLGPIDVGAVETEVKLASDLLDSVVRRIQFQLGRRSNE